ncbi:NADH-ubiquinone oxidoreductase-F iron-sulfur binding region domain-containing protein [Clostridium estertheticum]|uniref:NADH-ubiquinone oxidoreductase-F iron-sulfur binding region domain-containing protein n=1 Tax=Clostridium estertheticum TaxID=238834 RepID=UPI001C7D4AE4|nr:NADH-ubiquinone oxidoreductase-F iron-sulfur binding region domain-containing protein [Clostridium estertheticum]MBX4267887.1 4Fe-4S binding protein [Clostridium estertheticum]WLC78118.1 4Fe-4S binding protein [Clostridium estertheticum]
MSEYLICNAVSAYKEAPVSIDILKNSTSQVLEAIYSKKAKKNYIILDAEEKDIKSKIETEAKNYPDMDLNIIFVDGSFGFVYRNASAILKVIEGEKPIPSSAKENDAVCTVEMLLESEYKNVYVDGSIKNKGKFSLSKNISPRELLETCGVNGIFKGMYLGYPMGVTIGEGDLENKLELSTDYIRIFDETDCILDQLKNISKVYTRETCGRCVFGHEGVTQINMLLSDISQKKGKSSDVALLLDLCGEMKNQVLCGIDATLATTVISAISNFKEEIEEHITKKVCKASACSKFFTYHILADKCIGCTECQDVCEEDAILGKRKFIHVIDQGECTQCGACLAACDEEAIVKAGPIKPRCPQKPIPCKR